VDAVARVDAALAGRLCVSAWLGYGDVLFLGFGDQPLPERGADGRRPMPPFELQTNFADWSVSGPEGTTLAISGRGELEAAVKSLLGLRVVGWELLAGHGLRVAFAGGSALTVAPWPASEGASDAWSLDSRDGRVVAVATGGQIVLVSAAG
jgi:hypothetical protein